MIVQKDFWMVKFLENTDYDKRETIILAYVMNMKLHC